MKLYHYILLKSSEKKLIYAETTAVTVGAFRLSVFKKAVDFFFFFNEIIHPEPILCTHQVLENKTKNTDNFAAATKTTKHQPSI